MCHHVMLRGIDGIRLFYDDADRSRFCLLLQESVDRQHHRVHAFCLMSNHIHLVLEPTCSDESLAECVHKFAFRYAQYYNKRFNRSGYLYQGRFRSILVEDGVYLRRLIRYIHLNPVEAKLVSRPEDYRWSSHSAYLGIQKFTWLETDRVLARFGDKRSDALSKLLEYTSMKMESGADDETIRKASRVGVLGTEDFIRVYASESIEEVQNNPTITEEFNSLDEVVQAVCQYFGVTIDELRGSGRGSLLVDARSIIAYVCRLISGTSLGEASAKLGKHHGTMSKLAKRAEENSSLHDLAWELISSSN